MARHRFNVPVNAVYERVAEMEQTIKNRMHQSNRKTFFNGRVTVRRTVQAAVLLLAGIVVLNGYTAIGGHPGMGKEKQKTGILLVTFGTSNAEAREAFRTIERQAEKRFENVEIRWAYTSHMIRNILEREGTHVNSPVSALAKMHDDGFTHVAVQSLHVIAGEEYNQLKDTVQAFRRGPFGFEKLPLGKPLLASYEDVKEVCEAMLENVPEKRNEDEAVILMGHGTHHQAGLSYLAVASVLNHMDNKAFLGTVEGHPTLDGVIKHCEAAGVKNAWLMPFMSVAGDHARNDMAGESDDSWKSVLEKNGIECNTVLTGMGEYDNVVKVWLHHLAEALEEVD